MTALNQVEQLPPNRPSRWALVNWPVRRKVLAIVLLPLLLTATLGGLRIYSSATEAADLRRAADRAELVPMIVSYMAALEGAVVTATEGTETQPALADFDARKGELDQRLVAADVVPDLRLAVDTLLNRGQDLVDKVTSNAIDLRQRVTSYAPLLQTAETAITGSVSSDDETVRLQAEALSRAVGARGQMAMQKILVDRGADVPDPELRTSMITLAGNEPSTISGMARLLGTASEQASALRSEMVARMSLLSDPAVVLPGNSDLLKSMQVTKQIADSLIAYTTEAIPAALADAASAQRAAAIRDAAVVLLAILATLVIVVLVARSLINPLRMLRDGALKVAHEDLAGEIERVRTGAEPGPVVPLAIHTTEEVGQVAHAVDELHEQAVLLAGEQSRLRLQMVDMFETLSRRSRSLVDQQLSLIDRLERNEEDPELLESLFRLDHLAARMRRNGANLLVLAGAKIPRDEAAPVPVSSIINAAASEVEDYARVIAATVPDSEIVGAAAGDVVHLLAELLDNALRYSPPISQVRVSAAHDANGELVIEVSDIGIGITEADLRVANTRLQTGAEVSPYTARHMGLFVVGRLAEQQGLVVRLRSTVAGEPSSGITAEVNVPAALIARAEGFGTDPEHPRRPQPGATADATARIATAPAPDVDHRGHLDHQAHHQADHRDEPVGQERGSGHLEAPVGVLPQRAPGASGIFDAEPATPEPAVAADGAVAEDEHAEGRPRRESTSTTGSDDAIYQKMLSEWLIDPTELANFDDLVWESVWDRGWSAAAAAEEASVQQHTEEGLPLREPGARLVPGGVHTDRGDDPGDEVASAAESDAGQQPIAVRDPDAVRTTISNHFGGVQAGRSQAGDTRGTDTE